MNRRSLFRSHGLVARAAGIAILLLAALLLAGGVPSAAGLSVNPLPESVDSPSAVMFIENAGQFDERARFQVRGGMGTMWLAEDAIWITVVERSRVDTLERSPAAPLEHLNVERDNAPRKGVNLKLTFPGANPHPRIEAFDRLDTVVSYFIGNDPDQWHADVSVWAGVRYVDLYPGVDVEITSQSGRWSWQVVADDGTPLSEVRLRVEGADDPVLDGRHLCLTTAVGELALPLPTTDLALQVEGITSDSEPIPFHQRRALPPEAADGQQRTAEGLAVDRQRSAIIQDNPDDLLYTTFLGGDNSDYGCGIAVDGTGHAYVTGDTQSADFPTTPGAFDISYNNGGPDGFVVKLNAAGTALEYATFLGGSSWDYGWGIVVDEAGAAYITGETRSADFPTTAGAFDTSYNGGPDVFVVKLNAAGTALEYATFLGGHSSDHGNGIAVDEGGAAYVTGRTSSADFPTTAEAFDPFQRIHHHRE